MWTGKLDSSATQGCYPSAPPCHQQGCEEWSTGVGAGAKSSISIPPSPAPGRLPRLDVTGGHMDHGDHCSVCRRKLGPQQPQPTSAICARLHPHPRGPCGALWLRVWNPWLRLGSPSHQEIPHSYHALLSCFRPGWPGRRGCFFSSSWWRWQGV